MNERKSVFRHRNVYSCDRNYSSVHTKYEICFCWELTFMPLEDISLKLICLSRSLFGLAQMTIRKICLFKLISNANGMKLSLLVGREVAHVSTKFLLELFHFVYFAKLLRYSFLRLHNYIFD